MDQVKDISKWLLPSARWKRLFPVLKLVYRMMAVNAELICRHSFGVRYWPKLIGGFLLFCLYVGMIYVVTPQQPPKLIGSYLLILLLVLCYHLVGLFRRHAQHVHSYSPGQSWEFWERIRFSANVVRLLFEPGLLIIVGWIIFPIDT